MKQRMVNVKFWDDSYVTTLNPTEKLLFLYLITNPLTNVSGIYEINTRRINFDTAIVDSLLEYIFKKFEDDKKIIYSDGWICVVNFIKNQSLNPSIIKGIKRELKLVPRKTLLKFATACDSLRQDGTRS